MADIVDALLKLEWWQVALVVVATVAGSSAASAWITSWFESSRQSRTFRREVRGHALSAIGKAYESYLKYGNASATPSVDAARDQEVAERSASMHVAVAAIGDTNLLPQSRELSVLGELFASQDEATSVSNVDEKFTELVEKISKQVPS
ncbi:MAG: hypothetical protein H7288_21685 [Kineosporiaceae bacterium]|nr:hypothetical protein [Aeromicrobium sp.]